VQLESCRLLNDYRYVRDIGSKNRASNTQQLWALSHFLYLSIHSDYQGLPLRPKTSLANSLECACLPFMLSLLRSVLKHQCSHQFLWPQRRSEGGHYQICIRCGDQYVYDWETMSRAARITAFAASRTLAPRPTPHVPRAQRFPVRKPIFYRQVNHSQYRLAMLVNISASGLLLECHPSIPEGTSLEMILQMPPEITGQPYRTVLCRGEIVRSALGESGIALVVVAISDYSFGARDRDRRISLGQACLLPKPG
jgi:hypothetical protein